MDNMQVNFTSLAQATKMIGEIADNAKVMHTNFMQANTGDIMAQITAYIHEVFLPLYDTDLEFGINHQGISLTKKKGCVTLYHNIAMGGWADTFVATFTPQGVKYGAPSPQMVLVFATHWQGFKAYLLRVVEKRIQEYNEQKAREVQMMVRQQEVINNFTI